MQSVSNAYKSSMKAPLRNRGYIQVNFGEFNESVQSSAELTHPANTYIWYSDDSRVFDGGSDIVYGTLENNFFKVDGSMKLLPPEDSSISPLNSGIVSDLIVDDGNVIFNIRLNQTASWYGLMIDFGENYPTSFDIVYGSNTEQIDNNTDSLYVAELPFADVSSIQIRFWEMKESGTRARVNSVRFGVGYTFGNDDVIDSSITRSISPITEFIPQYDFSVTLKNYDRRFDVDNPNSVVNFLSPNVPYSVLYGYELDNGKIEWVLGQQFHGALWESNDMTATIQCQDILRDLDGEFNGTAYDEDGVSYGDLAELVLDAAGITEYSIHSSMYEITTVKPLPHASYKELLQMIANAACCVLTINRAGGVVFTKIDDTITPDFRMQKLDMLTYPKAIAGDLVKSLTVEYESWFKNGTEESLIDEDISVSAGDELTFYFGEPTYGYRVSVNHGGLVENISASGDYFITLHFNSSFASHVEIFGKKYSIVKRTRTKSVNSTGKSMTWGNPLINGYINAGDVGDWLKAYYLNPMEYQYSTRGNPELDVGDIIYQDNEYRPSMKVLVTDYSFNFKQSFSGQVITKMVGGSN